MLAGVYAIKNIKSNKVYVGSSSNIKIRFFNHKSELNRGVHDNEYLQRSWDKYGEDSFLFNVVEECNNDNLVEREQFWINILSACDRSFGYNISPRADRRIHSEETKRKMSIKRIGRKPGYKHGLSRTKEYRIKYSREYYKKNKEELTEKSRIYKRKYRAANRDKAREADLKYYRENRKEINERKRNRYAKNPEPYRQYKRLWRSSREQVRG